MDCPERPERGIRKAAFLFMALLLLFLLAAGCAAAEERHTVQVKCSGDGFVGNRKRRQSVITVEPEAEVRAEDGTVLTLEELRKLEGFRLEGAALRFKVAEVQGLELPYTLMCEDSRAAGQTVREGLNLWDVTGPVGAWMEAPEEELSLIPLFTKSPWGMKIAANSMVLQLTFTTAEKLPDFPMDKVRFSDLYENSLSMLEADSPFIAQYDDTADSLLAASLPLGVPYYYAGGTEDKFLRRFIPTTPTNYYLDTHMYLCGLDCVGMTHLVYEKCGLERHPSISDLLHWGIGSKALKGNDPSRWSMMLQPGDLIAVKHGTYHILMYLGTMRQFGWRESFAGEAADLLDAPLVIHCGGNPFYHERYKQYISEQGYRNTYPPDGGVTVSVIRKTDKDAPHSTDTSWGKHFGWYELEDGKPLLVFQLADCSDIAWYGPELGE